MITKEKQELINQLRTIRCGNDDAKKIIVSATSGEIEIKNQQVINNVLDYLLKELLDNVAKELTEC